MNARFAAQVGEQRGGQHESRPDPTTKQVSHPKNESSQQVVRVNLFAGDEEHVSDIPYRSGQHDPIGRVPRLDLCGFSTHGPRADEQQKHASGKSDAQRGDGTRRLDVARRYKNSPASAFGRSETGETMQMLSLLTLLDIFRIAVIPNRCDKPLFPGVIFPPV